VSTQLAAPPRPVARPGERTGGTSVAGLVAKILLLGLVAALAVWAAFPLIQARAWIWLAVEAAVTALIFYVYLKPRRLPLKYLLPGTLFLVVFQILPVLLTMSTAFTNFGDGHRGGKADAIRAIQVTSVVEVPGSPEYALKVIADGDPATGRLAFLLTDPAGRRFLGDAGGLRPVSGMPDGYVPLGLGQAGARSKEITDLVVPTAGGAIRSSGISRAYEGRAQRFYDKACDCVVDKRDGHRWTARDGSFVDAAGERLPQGWRIGVGLRNLTDALTEPGVAKPFFRTLTWNLVFAVTSVLVTFVLGMACAIALHSDRVRGRTLYRTLLVLPYAMPSFAMLLVWRDMFNTDFGLINKLLGVSVDWLGVPWTARLAVILVQLWLGYPYMFLVATGALQAIPREMTEAASMDGASAWQAFRRVTLPLLLVALSPLLISSFAFNFNNFNAIYLTTEGGPFPASDPTVGATDLLITYTYRLAFGGSGAQFGFAAAISIYIFAIVALISTISFRRTRRLEEVYS
jgi:arabinogalactan oligomer/maltooligosaccharide transport system permease protein